MNPMLRRVETPRSDHSLFWHGCKPPPCHLPTAFIRTVLLSIVELLCTRYKYWYVIAGAAAATGAPCRMPAASVFVDYTAMPTALSLIPTTNTDRSLVMGSNDRPVVWNLVPPESPPSAPALHRKVIGLYY